MYSEFVKEFPIPDKSDTEKDTELLKSNMY